MNLIFRWELVPVLLTDESSLGAGSGSTYPHLSQTDNRFHIALFFALEQTHCAFVTCHSKYVAVAFTARFEYRPKWRTYGAVWLLRSWCHVKLLPSRRVLCTPYNLSLIHISEPTRR